MKQVTIDYAGTITVSPSENPISLYQHQTEAIEKLNGAFQKKEPFAGLLVLPTGGGKTLTAVHWILSNFIDHNKKVLWVAHRHQLLDQALDTFRNHAYRNLLKKRKEFRYRVVSGLHDRPVNIQSEDDVLIASKDSLYRGIDRVLSKWLHQDDEVLLVIDEAHHTVAKTYRSLVETFKKVSDRHGRPFSMIGLTATPFRTAENEQGLLGKLFHNDIVYGISLRDLISKGILSEPIFEELVTRIDMTTDLTDEDVKTIQAFDTLPEHLAKHIAESKERNHAIVSHYVQNKEKYGQLLVFSISVEHAIALNVLFKDRGIASEFVVSDVRDSVTGVVISTKENQEKIQQFREGKINVLVNVNILTEGTDLPKVQTVFLTRPTTSTILMTQMVGRGLRGKKAGGTEKAYIVSFIDEWKDKINWVNPRTVIGEIGIPPNGNTNSERIGCLVAVHLIEQFARMMDKTTNPLEAIDFIQRIPVGVYYFVITSGDKSCCVMVFDNLQTAYENFVNSLEELFAQEQLRKHETLTDEQLERLHKIILESYFEDCDLLPGYRDEDIKDILRYYAQTGLEPAFLEFKERDKCDLTQVARYIYDNSLGGQQKASYIKALWNDETAFWKLLFSSNEGYFRRQLSIEIEKTESSQVPSKPTLPVVTIDTVNINRLSLAEMKEKAPEEWRKLREEVYGKYTDAEGYITSASGNYRSKSRVNFQIDHIVPMSEGGLSTIENLRILTRQENFFMEQIHRAVNTFYQGPAFHVAHIKKETCFVTLHKGYDPKDIEPQLQKMVNQIRLTRESGSAIQKVQVSQPDSPMFSRRIFILTTLKGYLTCIPQQEDFLHGLVNSHGLLTIQPDESKIQMLVPANTDDCLLYFTRSGKIFSQMVNQISEISLTKGIESPNQEVITAIAVPSKEQGDLIFLTSEGLIRRTPLIQKLLDAGIAKGLSVGIPPRWVKHTCNKHDVMIVSRKGQAIRFCQSEIPQTNYNVQGVLTIKLINGDTIAGMDIVDLDTDLLIVTEQGFFKRTVLTEYPTQKRLGKGVRTIENNIPKTGHIVSAHTVTRKGKIIVITQRNKMLSLDIADIPIQGRTTLGKRMIDLAEGDKIAMAFVVEQ